MRTKYAVRVWAFCAVLLSGVAAEPATKPTEAGPRPAIRDFDVETISRLGREIYEQDQLAWHATDALQSAATRTALQSEQPAGWIVDATGERPVVRFLRRTSDGLEASRDVIFRRGQKPEVVIPESRTLSAHQLARARAVRTAERALLTGDHPWCGGTFNYVVLDDPDGNGLLVYFLRAKPADHLIPVGGHYRITVSDDGESVEQLDQLFASCFTMDRNSAPKEGETVAVAMSHVVSATPLETHVFLSLQEKLPFSVITPDGTMWMIENGRLSRADAEPDPATPSGK